MKCIWYWKWKTEGEEYSKVSDKFQEVLKKHPEELPKLSVEEWKLEIYFEADYLMEGYRKYHPELF